MGKDAPAASIDEVVAQAIRDLDLETKVSLLTGGAVFSLRGEDSIGLREMIFSDGPTGVRGSEFTGGSEVALFPNATLLAQSWDETAADRSASCWPARAVASTWMSYSVRRSTCIDRRSAAGCSRPTPRTRCSVAGLPRRTSAGCRSYGVGACVKHLAPTSPRPSGRR